MLWDFTAMRRYSVMATDGTCGTVEDFIFEDVGWAIRWLVVQTGGWWSRRATAFQVNGCSSPFPHSVNPTRRNNIFR